MTTVNPPKIYAILNYESCGHPVSQLRKLLTHPYEWIQLRAKTISKTQLGEFAEQAIRLRKELRLNNTKLIINDFADIAAEVGADGVHLGQEDMLANNIYDVREKLGAASIIGCSTHTLDQAVRADTLPINYVAIGPIFHSTTKSGHAKVVGVEGLKEICTKVSKPVVAIGGINEANLKSVYAAGASSVALISALEKL